MHCETPCPPSRPPRAVPGPVPSLAPPASAPETYLVILALREADQPLFLSGMKTAGGHLGLRTGETVRNAGKQDWWEPGTGRACVPSRRGPHVFMPRATDAVHMLSRPVPPSARPVWPEPASLSRPLPAAGTDTPGPLSHGSGRPAHSRAQRAARRRGLPARLPSGRPLRPPRCSCPSLIILCRSRPPCSPLGPRSSVPWPRADTR